MIKQDPFPDQETIDMMEQEISEVIGEDYDFYDSGDDRFFG